MQNNNIDIDNLFELYYRPLCIYALNFISDKNAIEDIVQDSYVDLWQRISSGHTILNIKSYLYKVVKNRSLAEIKLQATLADENDLPNQIDDSDEMLEKQSFREAKLWAMIDTLPESCRNILIMSKRDGMKYNEIAEELSISVKTVENQMSKALKRLKEFSTEIFAYSITVLIYLGIII